MLTVQELAYCVWCAKAFHIQEKPNEVDKMPKQPKDIYDSALQEMPHKESTLKK